MIIYTDIPRDDSAQESNKKTHDNIDDIKKSLDKIQKAREIKNVKNDLIYLSGFNVHRNSLLAAGFQYIPHFIDPSICVSLIDQCAMPFVTNVNHSGEIISVSILKTSENQITAKEIKWKTKIGSQSQEFLGGINQFANNETLYTSVVIGNKLIIRNNKLQQEQQYNMPYSAKCKPYIKTLNNNQILMIFQDMKNSIICCRINLNEKDSIYFTENPSSINAVTKTNATILEHNKTLFFSDENEIRIFTIDTNNATLSEIANIHIGTINAQEMTSSPFIRDNKINFWIKTGNLLHLKTIDNSEVKDIHSYNLDKIIDNIRTQTKAKYMKCDKITFIDHQNMIIYDETIAILLSYNNEKIYFKQIISTPKDTKLVSINTNKNIISALMTHNNKTQAIIADINNIIHMDSEYTPEESNIITMDNLSNKIYLDLFPLIIISNHQFFSIYYHQTKALKVKPIDSIKIQDYISAII